MTANRVAVPWRWAWLSLLMLSTPACMQKMADQPAYRPLEHSTFFADGRTSRPLVDGVFTRDQMLSSNPLVRGLTLTALTAEIPQNQDDPNAPLPPARHAPSDPAKFVSDFPDLHPTRGDAYFTERDLLRGQERFTIYCAVCHGPLGDGKGKIFERGYLKPTSFLTENSRGFQKFGIDIPMPEVPVGYYFEVVTKGYGGMPSYASQLKPKDRWRIIAYIRALQLSASANLDELPESAQEQAREELETAE